MHSTELKLEYVQYKMAANKKQQQRNTALRLPPGQVFK
jgi:hypothetical protein